MKNLIILLLFITTSTFAHEWQVKKSAKNSVKFISTTPVLDFEGKTENIDGFIYWEGDSLFAKDNQLYFEVPINSIDTGIGKRDRDMREIVLESHKFPTAYFQGKIISFEKIGSGKDKYSVIAEGEMFIHGVKRDKKIEGQISFSDGLMNINTNFSVMLNDYNIEAPSLLAFVKVAEEIKLEMDFSLEKVN